MIHNNHGKKWVEKSAADREAGAHIRKLCENSLAAGTKEKVFRLPGEWKDEKVRFAYLTEKSLEEKVLSVLKTDGKEQAFGLIRDFFDAYFERYQKVMFTPGKEFREIFGETGCENAWEGIRGGNLDLVLDNVYCQQERYCIIDCEWIFDFELPVKFIIWRSLNDFCIKHEETELLDWFGITEDEIRQFKEWNVHFVYKWLKANGTERFAKAKKYVSMDYMAGLYRKENYLSCSLYYDCGEGYSEEQKVFAEVAMQDRHFEVNFDLSCVEGIRRMRFDPEEGRACRCCLDKNEWGFLPVNAQKKENEWDVFLTGDPIYEAVPGENSVIRRVTVSGEIRYTDFNEWERQLMEIQEEMRCRMEEERNRYQEEMRQQKAREEVLQKELSDSRSKLQHTGELLGVSEAKAAELAAMAAHQREILDSIYNSRGWKALSFVRRMVKRGKVKNTIERIKNAER